MKEREKVPRWNFALLGTPLGICGGPMTYDDEPASVGAR
jgi:hypothetical protein